MDLKKFVEDVRALTDSICNTGILGDVAASKQGVALVVARATDKVRAHLDKYDRETEVEKAARSGYESK